MQIKKKKSVVLSKKTKSWLAELTCICAYLIGSLSSMHYLSEQSCGLEQAIHRKQKSINHIDPTGYWGCTSPVVCMFILLTRVEGQQQIGHYFAQIVPCSFTFAWNLFHLAFMLPNICFNQNTLQVRCMYLHWESIKGLTWKWRVHLQWYQLWNLSLQICLGNGRWTTITSPDSNMVLSDPCGECLTLR